MRYSMCKAQWDIALTLPSLFVTVDSSNGRAGLPAIARQGSKRNA